MLSRFRYAVDRVFDQNVYSTRLRAFYTPLICVPAEARASRWCSTSAAAR